MRDDPAEVLEVVGALHRRMPAWFARLRRARLDAQGYWLQPSLARCPYYTGKGTCAFGCYEEPACHTCCPRGGWPPYRTRDLLRRLGVRVVGEGDRA